MATEQSRALQRHSPPVPLSSVRNTSVDDRVNIYAKLSEFGTTSPSVDVLLESLAQIGARQQLASGGASSENEDSTQVENAILSKVAVSAYSILTDRLLEEALEAENEAEWWGRIERSRWSTSYFLLQSALRGLMRIY